MVALNFGIIIQARTSSTRYPEKVLKKIDKKNTVLDFQIKRVLNEFKNKYIFIATTTEKKDKKICLIAKKNNVNFFRGSEKNVLKRYLDCAKKFEIKNIARITSDCPLVDPKLIKKMLKLFLKKKIDYFANTYPISKSTFPDGSDIEIFNFKSLKKAYKLIKNKEDKEHVTTFFWKNKTKFKCGTYSINKNLSKYRFSIDYKDDLEVVRKIIKHINSKNLHGSAIEITNFLKKNNHLNNIGKKNIIRFFKYRKDLY